MHLFFALAALLTFAPATATQDLCPKDEYACLDIINASQCLAQLVIQKMSPLTKENIIKCVETEGVASNLPGAQKLCRCPGCHTEPINAAIREMFPLPCV
ncbi:hypothetical protein PMIN06_004549 [Paraphaeosphaeria minitans]|uniref:Uncharacterized protein n=1 Tax=Paraphaeosphaeria minitans TaxID=565426 RepID=A0A9P6GQR8_9PLEO|nr:hypothetical protein PMIN01_04083 [Paraphaeosphaeria minitans]